MTHDDEPMRWSEGDADSVVQRLVRAGQQDGPSARALRAAPVAVATLLSTSAAAATLAQAGGVAGALVGKGATSTLVLLKWIGVGTLAGSSLMALAQAPKLWRTTPLPVPTEVPRGLPQAPRNAPEPAVPVVVVAPPSTAEPVSSGAERGASARRADVAREVTLLDAARAALIAGSPAQALQLLDSLERLPERGLAPEATVLRVRALLAHGEAGEARRIVDQFCARAPDSPQALSLRALVNKTVIQSPPSRL